VPPGRDARLIVMAKHPAPGRVKTRLAATLGAERACALYRAFVLDLAERLDALPYDVTWAYWPRAAPFAKLLPRARCRPQRGADLGDRMANAVAECGGPVVVIGADTPHVPAARLEEAVQALAGAADLVLGPADDGGYYLIGLRAPTRAVFAGVAWGTSRVLAETLARAGGLRTLLLEPCFDVDTPADLVRLSDVLARGDVTLPRTGALLAVPPHGP
jgi:uncharacterized protein